MKKKHHFRYNRC